tara:strand:+ start:343 stop:627 length:285 start_codon:yes stop_codon:yes gene_type:complete
MNSLYNAAFISVGGLSGGLLYFTLTDLDKIYIKKTQYFPTPLNSIYQLFNQGFLLGTGLGISYVYTGRPFMDNVFLWLGRTCINNIQSSITGTK